MKKLVFAKKLLTLVIILVSILTTITTIFAEETVITDTDGSTVLNGAETTTAMRMQPLTDKYNSLTQADLNKELDKLSDISNHWGKNYISKISALEIITGYGNGKFGPNDTLLGGQYMIMLIRTMGFKPETPKGTPSYKPFVDIALAEKILKKDEIKDFNKPITRELAASLARRVVSTYEEVPHDYFVKGTDYEGKGDKGFFDNVYVGYQKLKMRDWNTVSDKYLQDVFDCYRMGLINGSDNKFNPKGYLTRAEATVVVVKLLDKTVRKESVPGESESFKFTNPLTMDAQLGYCSEEYGRYDNKTYTLYKGLFPLMEIWDTVNIMNKSKELITEGATFSAFREKDKNIGISWFESAELQRKYRLENYDGLLIPLNGIAVYTHKTAIKKGEQYSLYDNDGGYLYEIHIADVDNYSKLQPLTYELMKVWFGTEYETAKKLHDRAINDAMNSREGDTVIKLLNGRQIIIWGGHDLGGRGFSMQVWAKDIITKDTMFKY